MFMSIPNISEADLQLFQQQQQQNKLPYNFNTNLILGRGVDSQSKHHNSFNPQNLFW